MRKHIGLDHARRLFNSLDDSIYALLIINSGKSFQDDNFWYLTDVKGGEFEGSIAIATRRNITIITSALEKEIARTTGCSVRVFSNEKERENQLKSVVGGKAVIGINEKGISYSTMKWLRKSLKNSKFKDVSGQLMNARMIKDEEEIGRMKKACRIASKVADELPEILRIDMSETEAAAEIDYLLRYHGADGPAFETIAAFGPATSMPHYLPGKRRLKSGSVALFDFGALYKNYRSDITRTFLTKPKNDRIARIYNIVLRAQKAAIAKCVPGMAAKEIDMAARKIVEREGYGEQFIHSTGHGLGIAAHDPGVLSKKSKDIMKANMIFTIEPGIYFSRSGGVRIEDDILVTSGKAKRLTNTSRELTVI